MIVSQAQKNKLSYSNPQCISLLHEDNYLLLNMLLPEFSKVENNYKSTFSGKPLLSIKVLNRFKYTLEITMNYTFEFGDSEEIKIKIYHDANVAEIVSCSDLQEFIRLMGPKINYRIHAKTRASLTVFLNKWLCYLLKNGYHQSKWQAVAIPNTQIPI